MCSSTNRNENTKKKKGSINDTSDKGDISGNVDYQNMESSSGLQRRGKRIKQS
eukprot:CAMPEP_0197257446 /NCGR_PEP_ID=MMETSP1429-20130617/78708_1 /TAXON_ID=49237 /ORGANISM="Chaetoceros  sp., Strain UNC1202" /LENGTH=52 /DNA_ID=CAMNT_0042721283 /DNA_START=31 /DNA_END=186 /DNA_ORIENTATION=-